MTRAVVFDQRCTTGGYYVRIIDDTDAHEIDRTPLFSSMKRAMARARELLEDDEIVSDVLIVEEVET